MWRKAPLCVGWCRTALFVCLITFASTSFAQGRPDIVWMRGGHTQSIFRVAFSPDGQYLVSLGYDSTSKLWGVPIGSLIRTFTGEGISTFSPDGQFLVGVSGTTVRIRRLDGALVRSFTVNSVMGITALACSPDGEYLAIGTNEGGLYLHRFSDGGQVHNLAGHTSGVLSVAFSPNGEYLASAGYDTTVRLWRVSDGSLVYVLSAHRSDVRSVAFSPDGAYLASGDLMSVVRMWRVSDGSEVRMWYAPSPVRRLEFSPNGQHLMAVTSPLIVFWRVADGSLERFIEGFVDWAVFSPDGEHLAIADSLPPRIRLWRIADQTTVRTFTGHSREIWGVAFSHDGQYLATASDDHTVRVWLRDSGTEYQRFVEHGYPVYCVAFAPNQALLASGGLDRAIRLWRVGGAQVLTLREHTGAVQGVAFAPDGRLLASASRDRTVRIWQLSEGTLSNTLTGHTGEVMCVAYSPDGQYLASGGWDNTVRLWRASDGALLYTLTGHTGMVASVAFSPDGQYLASASVDNTVRVWRVSDGTLVHALTGHTAPVLSVAFSRSGYYLLSGGRDGIRLWRVHDGALLAAYDEEVGTGVLSLQFSPDDAHFAYARADSTLVLARNPRWGDTNGDGCVDDADVIAVLFRFGQSGTGFPEDINRDGIVDDTDLITVLFAFGSGC